MSLDLGKLVGYLEIDRSDWDRGLDQADRDVVAFGNKNQSAARSAGQKIGHGISQGIKTSLRVGAIGAAATAALAYRVGRESIEEASTLSESLNAVNLSYNDQAKAVKGLGRDAAEGLGLSNSEFNSLAVRFSSFSKTIAGSQGKAVVSTLDDLTTRASDFASVMNLEVADSAALFQSGLAGETEPLRQYGIDLSAAAVQAHAYKIGLVDAGKELTEQEKVQARYSLLMKETSQTQGDFANTSDGLANSQRILGARWDNAQAKLGKGLMPIMKDAVGYLNREGIPAFLDFSDWFVKDGLPAIQDFVDDMRPLANELLPAAGTALGIVADGAKTAAPFIKDMVEGFNDLPDEAQLTALAAVVTGYSAFKLRGPVSTAAGVVSAAKPVPVFVTNPGGLGGLGGGAAGGGAGAAATKWGTLFGAAAKVGIIAAGIVAVDTINKQFPGVDKGLDAAIGDPADALADAIGIPDIIGEDTRSKPKGFELSSLVTNGVGIDAGNVDTSRLETYLDATKAKAAGLGRELDLVGSRKLSPQINDKSIRAANAALARFIDQQIEAGRPVTPYISLNGFDRAMAQINTIETRLHALPGAGLDNGVPFVSGGGPRSADPRGGVNFDFRGSTIQPHDYNDFTKQTQRRAQRTALGGRPE